MRLALAQIAAINILLLFADNALGAEADSRLEIIQAQRETMSMQKQVGQLLFENAVLKEEKLDREEAKIKAEKPKEEKKAE